MTRLKSLTAALIVVAGFSFAVPTGGTAKAPTLVQALAGRYSTHFLNGMADGERYWSDDIVEIVPVADDAAYFRVALKFTNAHECVLSGVAMAEDTQLVYRETVPADYLPSAKHRCEIRLFRARSELRMDDGSDSCRDYCGARGMLTWALPFHSRRAITYLPRLKASREYVAALAQWHAKR